MDTSFFQLFRLELLASSFIPHLISYAVVSVFLKYMQILTSSHPLHCYHLRAGRCHLSRPSFLSPAPSLALYSLFISVQMVLLQLKSDHVILLFSKQSTEACKAHPRSSAPFPLPTTFPLYWSPGCSWNASSSFFLGAFALAVPLVWNAFPCITCLIPSLYSVLCSNAT